jgi:hypothetical protein
VIQSKIARDFSRSPLFLAVNVLASERGDSCEEELSDTRFELRFFTGSSPFPEGAALDDRAIWLRNWVLACGPSRVRAFYGTLNFRGKTLGNALFSGAGLSRNATLGSPPGNAALKRGRSL